MTRGRIEPRHDVGIDPPGWGGTVMGWLRVATQLAALNLLWWLGLFVGAVLCGALPAGCAVHELARRSRRDPSMHLWRDYWGIYRAAFRPAAGVGAPLVWVAIVGVADLFILSHARGMLIWLLVPVVVISVMAMVVACYAIPLLGAADGIGTRETLRRAAAVAVASPATTIGMVATAAAAGIVTWCWPLWGVLFGVSLPLTAMTLLARERLLRAGVLPGPDRRYNSVDWRPTS
ncbi:DUF624 domain-containing protein [Actinomyces qiguomingii]|uniref:DUF624 domain-containing protein n=1 Tax=Actinomyces qiguomingii TaxID=2057800 RepID=UPI001304D564|nr:DUF624 domain-containing protein [Actinomyces qiguomingii]